MKAQVFVNVIQFILVGFERGVYSLKIVLLWQTV
jgi:hypothetical protein